MIPHRIHLWWNTDPPAPVMAAAESWQELHPHWDVHLWGADDKLTPALAAADHTGVVDDDRVRHRSNVVRWWLLATYGGVWVDTDTEPLHPLDELVTDDRPFCARVAVTEATVIGGPARHPLFAEAFARSTQRRTRPDSAPATSGAYLLDELARSHDVRVLEAGAFCDFDARGRTIRPPQHSPRYARHDWATSSRRATTL